METCPGQRILESPKPDGTLAHVRAEVHQGPLPPPETLRTYEEVTPDTRSTYIRCLGPYGTSKLLVIYDAGSKV